MKAHDVPGQNIFTHSALTRLPKMDYNALCIRVIRHLSTSSQGSRCDMPTQSCLGYQLDDLYKADLAAEKAGQPGDYFVENFEQGGERALLCNIYIYIP